MIWVDMTAPGIPSELLQSLRETLLWCGPFGNDHALQDVFVDGRLNAWWADVPGGISRRERMDRTVTLLSGRDNGQENGLVLFLDTLLERNNADTGCRGKLVALRGE